jgi:hypothetical protein
MLEEKTVHIIRTKNLIVTEYYYDLIRESISKIKETRVLVHDDILDVICKARSHWYVVGHEIDYLKLFIVGKRQIIIWKQGAGPEESFQRNNSITRYYVRNVIDKISIKYASFIITVSNELSKHLANKHLIDFKKRNYIIPCFNTNINKKSFVSTNKYKNNVFCYAGRLSIYQCFEESLDLYKKIEESGLNGVKLLVLTPEIDKALDVIRRKNITNYIVKYVNHTELPTALKDVKYGFALRDENVINKVATPTKLSTYMANGVIPIVRNTIGDFSKVIHSYKYFLRLSEISDVDDILASAKEAIEWEEVYSEYYKIFDKYYNRKEYVTNLYEHLKILIR